MLDNISVPFSGFKNPEIKPVTPNFLNIAKIVLAGKRLSTVVSVSWVVASGFVGGLGGGQSSRGEKLCGGKSSNQ